jgi:UDP-glucuronate 4-epimerase
MRILVTGAAGFIGSGVAQRLVTDGNSVVAVDAFTDYYDPALKRARAARIADPALTFVEGDLNDLDLTALLADVEVIFHLAGQPGVRSSWGTQFAEYTANNIDATQRLLEAASAVPGLHRFVYSSSSSVYGDAESYPTGEDLLPQPVSPYGVSKLAGEHLAYLYGARRGVPTVSLRYFTVYGPGQRPDMAFNRFIAAALKGEPIVVYGDGEQRRDFTFVDDVVAANLAVSVADLTPGSVFNVAGGTNTSVNEVIALLEEIHGAPIAVDYRPVVAGDVRRTSGTTTRIVEATGWHPTVSLETGLRAEYDWMREVLGLSGQ